MAAEEGFIVVLSGDSSPLEKAANDSVKSLDKVDDAADNASKGLSNVVNVSKQVSQAAQQVAKSADSAGGSLLKAANSGATFNKTLGGLQSQLRNFQQGLLTATNPESFNRIQRAIDATKQRIDNLSKIGDPFQKLTRGGGDATQTLVNVSRVAQDAPYGFIGIANNLNPLIESFQRLKVETGSTKQAFSSLVSGLAGPAGLGLAIGVVSSLLVTFGSHLFSSSDKADELAKSIKLIGEESKRAADSVQELQTNLNFSTQLQGLRIELGGGQPSAVIKKELLLTKNALGDLVDIYKREYGRNLITETNYFALSGKAREAADEAIKQHNEALEKLLGDRSEMSRKVALLELQVQLAEQKELKDHNEKIAEERDKALKKYQAQIEEAARLRFQFVKEMRVTEIPVSPPDVFFSRLPEIKNAYQANKDFEQLVASKFQGITIRPRVDIVPSDVKVDGKALDDALKKLDFEVKLREFSEKVGILVQQTQVNMASALGEGLGTVIVGQGFGNMFSQIGAMMGDFISQLGKYLITAAIKVKLFKEAFAKLLANPALALGVGITLVAIGSALKKNIPQPKAFAHGGLAFGPTLGLVGEGSGTSRSNPEVIAPLDKLQNFLGDNNTKFPDYLPVLEIGYDQLRLMYARANKQGELF